MGYYEDEILKELEIGKEYTERLLFIFAINNKHSRIISKTFSSFSVNGQRNLRVLDIIEGYIHAGDGYSTYYTPSVKSKVYIVE